VGEGGGVMKIPKPLANRTVDAIYRAYETRADNAPRGHLGASLIGDPCTRRLWFAFRWVAAQTFDGRMLRLFDTGHKAEPRFVSDLRAIGCEVHDTDEAGQQFRASAVGGHFGGSMDAAIIGLPEASKAWHVGEFKTHNAKSFAKLAADGVEKAHPKHFGQMQVYMALFGIERALYLAVNKDTDELHAERVKWDKAVSDALLTRAELVITSPEPPEKISTDPAYYLCKMCPFNAVCHGQALPLPNCRTCAHSTPELDGDARWSCAKWAADIPLDGQRNGCDEHRWIPALVAGQMELVESDGEAVTWRTATGGEIAQPPWKSSELHRIGLEMATDKGLRELKAAFPDSDVGSPMDSLEIDKLEAEFQIEKESIPF
jgi:hypothetical protein